MTVTVISDNTGADFSGSIDTRMEEDFATTNYGSDATISIFNIGAGDHKHTVIAFTGLSNIPSTDTVSDAYASIIQYDTDGGTVTIEARRLLRNWVEAQATWNIFSTSNNWGTAGGTNTSDRVDTVSASVSVNTALETYFDFTGTVIDTDTQNIVNLSVSNYGWHFKSAGADTGQYKLFRSSESTDGSRPKLTVTHAAASRPNKSRMKVVQTNRHGAAIYA